MAERYEASFAKPIRETANPHVMEKVDDNGNVLGFSVMKVSALRDEPLEVAL